MYRCRAAPARAVETTVTACAIQTVTSVAAMAASRKTRTRPSFAATPVVGILAPGLAVAVYEHAGTALHGRRDCCRIPTAPSSTARHRHRRPHHSRGGGSSITPSWSGCVQAAGTFTGTRGAHEAGAVGVSGAAFRDTPRTALRAVGSKESVTGGTTSSPGQPHWRSHKIKRNTPAARWPAGVIPDMSKPLR